MNLLEPRRIRPDDLVGAIDCGVGSLTNWLAYQALRNEVSGDSRTYVSIDADTARIAGYYWLASWAISRQQSGGWLARNAPEPVPVILLGRLAVGQVFRGIGLGGCLLAYAVRNATIWWGAGAGG